MGGMKRPWQFSIGYLLLETFWIAAALGFVTHGLSIPTGHDVIVEPSQVCFILCGIVCAGAAVGGLFRRMTIGFLFAFVIALWSIIAVVFGSSLLDQYLNR